MGGRGSKEWPDIRRIAGGFIAWMIGSGFATGQEILQFFTNYGYWSYGVVLINFIGFFILGQSILETGYLHRKDPNFNAFEFYCGKSLGKIYSSLVFLTLLLLIPILISGAGATLEEYFALNKLFGSAIMALMIFFSYLIGFQKLLKLVSFIGPLIIIFSLFIGSMTLLKDYPNFSSIQKFLPLLEKSQVSFSWPISAVLYLSLSFLCGTVYYTALGQTASSQNTARKGAFLGTFALILSIVIINTAILLNLGNTASLAIPVLFLAKKLSTILAGIFSIVLLFGIFSSSSAMMWSVCSHFKKGGKRGNRLFAFAVILFSFLISLLPFRDLVGVFYPLIGYVGLFFIFRVVYVSLLKKDS